MPSTSVSGEGGDQLQQLEAARELYLEGYYDRAVEAYRKLVDDPSVGVAAHVGWAAVDEQCGRYGEAIERLRGISDRADGSADWHAALARNLARVGQYDDALRHGRLAVERDAENCSARDELGRLLEYLDRRDEAVRVYAPFETRMHDRLPDRAEDLTAVGHGFLRYSVLTRNEQLVERYKHVLQEVYQEAFDFVDNRYWPARLAAAQMLLEKRNLDEARDDFRAVLKTSTRVVDAWVGLSDVAREQWDFDAAEKNAEQALAVNPRSVAALLALGRLRMLERKFDAAARLGEQILTTNPRSIEGLSLLAAAQLRAARFDESNAAIRRADAVSPHCAALQAELAIWLSAGRQYDDAEKHFLRAIEYDPTDSETRTQLGLMYMQAARERDARRALEASWALDRFNHETYNVLELLDELEHFSRRETAHFIIKYDAASDAVLVPYLAEELERLYRDVTAEFKTQPPGKTAIEVFAKHDRFAVRITGRPWIATVGACSGPIIAMDAPRRDAGRTPFNWARVLRHEFTHTVTLAATGNRIPHWMTEGLAVWAEHAPRSWEWMQLLADALRRDRLFTLHNVDWGFMRPRRPTDRSLAYAQSEWMIEYIRDRYGADAMGRLLEAFRKRSTQPGAFKQVLGVATRQFDRDFREWARHQAAGWGLPLDAPLDPIKVRARLAINPADADALAELAEIALLDGDLHTAQTRAAAALGADENNAHALALSATFLVSAADAETDESKRAALFDEAEPIIRRLAKVSPDQPRSLMASAIVDQFRGNWDAAIAAYERYQHLRPADPDAVRRMAGIFLVRQLPDRALPLLEQLGKWVDDDARMAAHTARIYSDRGDLKSAETWWRRAIRIDPYDPDSHRQLADVCDRLGDKQAALAELRAVVALKPDDADAAKRLTADRTSPTTAATQANEPPRNSQPAGD